jgi:hypothetical protein
VSLLSCKRLVPAKDTTGIACLLQENAAPKNNRERPAMLPFLRKITTRGTCEYVYLKVTL